MARPEPPRNGSSRVPKGTADAFRAELEAAGFIVQPGKMEPVDIFRMYLAGITPSCYGNNPSTPYLTAKLPMGPNQPQPNFTLITDSWINPANKGLWSEQMLLPTEAIVLVGLTPPEMKYFSYRSYVTRRYFPWMGEHRRIFASLGDTINNLTIATDKTPNGAPGKGLGAPNEVRGNPFSARTVIITTADRGVDARIREAAGRAGFPKTILNTDIIPTSLLKLGWGNEDDTFNTLIRIAFPMDKTLGDQYVAHPPLTVFRVTPKVQPEPDPFPMPALTPRGTGKMEFEVVEPDGRRIDLVPALDALRNALVAEYGRQHKAEDLHVSARIMDGFQHIQSWTDALGEIHDTIYLQSEEFLLGEDDFVIAYGVNHARTGKGLYSNLTMYGTAAFSGIGAVSDDDYKDTAERFLPGNPAARYLYVWRISRKEGPNTLTIPVKQAERDPYGVGLDEPGLLAFRVYVERETAVGPSWAEVVYDRVLRFSPE